MIENLTIRKQLAGICTVLVLFTVALGLAALFNVGRIESNLLLMVNGALPGVYNAATLDSQVFELRGNFWKHIANQDPAAKAKVDSANERQKQKIQETLQAYEKKIADAGDRRLFEAINAPYRRYLAAWEEIAPLSRAGKAAEAGAKYAELADPPHAELKAAIRALVDSNRMKGDNDAAAATGAVRGTRFWSWLALALSVLAGSVLGFLVTEHIVRTLSRAIGELAEGAEQVASAAGQVASSSQALAQGSSQQAASLEETSASSEQINAMARRNTENSLAASSVVVGSQAKFAEANRSLEEMVQAMGEIKTSSDRIARIIKTIDEIAFQTNILALNAAVEAARAGEAGMGFAVVADEVRNLSQRCARAAQDTESLIAESIVKSNDGKLKVDLVAEAIGSVTTEAGKVKTLVDEVSQGSQEQARGIEQIANAISQMEKVTQNTAASAEQGAAAAQQLTAQSGTLKDVVGRLTALVGGQTSRRVSRGKPASQAPREIGRSLGALQSAVSHEPAGSGQLAVLSPLRAGKQSFPLDDFTEF